MTGTVEKAKLSAAMWECDRHRDAWAETLSDGQRRPAPSMVALERLGSLDVDVWHQWRDLRNRLAHEYPDQAELRFAALLAAMDAARGMMRAYERWKPRLPS